MSNIHQEKLTKVEIKYLEKNILDMKILLSSIV